ncbi:DEAD/DEAH box helicase [Candidatus Micrarchaeota archaeon]|nr:DEAD/DEAH box helicase [Candidatus Micrarchaeota archaeon]
MLEQFSPKRAFKRNQRIKYGEVGLNPIVKSVFSQIGIEKLYKHQAEGIKKVKKGKNVVITAPTASGKSEIFLSAIVEKAVEGKTVLLLYPTKALERDQLKRFEPFRLYGIRAEIYDGDVPQHKRKKIRENPPQVLITNMDMLHHILLNNRLFEEFLSKLGLVVVDEIHTYSGTLGAHSANIVMRLKRLLKNRFKRKLQFIATSATVMNAGGFCEKLFGEAFEEVKGAGGSRGKVEHVLINPETESYTTTSLRVAEELGVKTLIFGNSHSVVERLGLMGKGMDIPVMVYRAGLTYKNREKLEQEFKKNRNAVMATTSALELGMDMGDVDAVILAGFPGSITKVEQRIGRCGRKGQEAYGVFIARESPLDMYYYENEEEYLHGEPESCYVNPGNGHILKWHVLSSAKDLMLTKEEIEENGWEEIVKELEEEGLMKRWGYFYSVSIEGARRIHKLNIRSGGKNIRILDAGTQKQIGQRDIAMAIGELFEGAIYLHGGRAFVSKGLDLENGVAYVELVGDNVEAYTQPVREREAEVLEEKKHKEMGEIALSYGKIHIRDSVSGFVVKDVFRGTRIGNQNFEEPYVYEYDTYALWMDIDPFSFDVEDFQGGIHGFEHVFISMSPAVSGGDQKEVGGISYPSGRMYVYEGMEEGNGISDIIYSNFSRIARMSYERLKNCECESGCPKCILDSQCGNDNYYLHKDSAKEISKRVKDWCSV